MKTELDIEDPRQNLINNSNQQKKCKKDQIIFITVLLLLVVSLLAFMTVTINQKNQENLDESNNNTLTVWNFVSEIFSKPLHKT